MSLYELDSSTSILALYTNSVVIVLYKLSAFHIKNSDIIKSE